MVTKTYLPSYLRGISDGRDSSVSHQKLFSYFFSSHLKTWKFQLWQLKNSNCENSKNQIVTKLKLNILQIKKLEMCQNPNFEIIKKIKLWQNSKTLIVTKLKNLNYNKAQQP